MFENKTILITGGTGSLGKALTAHILKNHPEIKKLIIYSRDEQKQFQMAQEYPAAQYPQIRFFIGDVRDLERLKEATYKVDYIIHAAAMKHVNIAQQNPFECVQTNVNGAQNVITAALENRVSKVVAISTDKACAPTSIYGATKLASDQLFINAQQKPKNENTIFSVIRYGNVMGCTGSVVPYFLERKAQGKSLPITHPEMTRFTITAAQCVEMIAYVLENAWGGELFVPKIPSFNIMDLANAIDATAEKPIVGLRAGEKIHEEMISETDSLFTYDLGKYFVILPQQKHWDLDEYIAHFKAKKVADGFCYQSNENEMLNTTEIEKMIKDWLY